MSCVARGGRGDLARVSLHKDRVSFRKLEITPVRRDYIFAADFERTSSLIVAHFRYRRPI